MSTENKVVDRQPQPNVVSDSARTSVSGGVEQTTQVEYGGSPGLKYLQNLSELTVHQRLDALEASVCFHRQLTGALRGLVLKMSLTYEDQEDVLLLRRPGSCSSRCCWACCNLQHMDVLLPSGAIVAKMSEVWNCCVPEYRVTDGEGRRLWTVKGGVCHCRCCCQLSFQFLGQDGNVEGSLVRNCNGCKEICSAVNSYSVDFGDGLTAQQKLLVLGCSFLIDLNYFEKQNKCW